MIRTYRNLTLAASLLAVSAPVPAAADDFFVATDGDDGSGDGSGANPWATIDHAVDSIGAEGGHVIIVRDGTYEGQTVVRRAFAAPVTVRAENPYRAVLTNAAAGGEAIRVFVVGSVNLVIQGFTITNSHPSNVCSGREPFYLIHLQDASDVELSGNIIFGANAPGTCNELVKVNRSMNTVYGRGIVIRGNLFYDMANAGGADMIDAVRPGEIDIVDNVFFGNPLENMSQSFITIKRQALAPADARSPRYRIARNVFMSWGGKGDQAFVQFGEDGDSVVEIDDALIENNLFIGNSAAGQAAPIQLKGAANVLVRANTIVGDLPSGAFGVRMGTEGDNPDVSGFEFRNNIWADPTGTMTDRLINSYGRVDVGSIVLTHNLYWNAGNALPTGGSVTPADDSERVELSPMLPDDQSGLVEPRWDPAAPGFPGGEATIREVFLALVESFGALGDGSAAVDAADPTHMPADDIRGLARGSAPDLGAYERGADTPAPPVDGGVPVRDGGGIPSTDSGTGGTDSGMSGADTGTPGGDDAGGCGCRVQAGKDVRTWPVTAFFACIFVVLVQRRRRR
ncbi:MAG: hypothetical protein DRJ42_29070 [Deltaproteobacteria bacterium]|nr:MAG: hypothetical protein DRJ42_29070 [Deltaproteobacteria bacterium]